MFKCGVGKTNAVALIYVYLFALNEDNDKTSLEMFATVPKQGEKAIRDIVFSYDMGY